MEVNVLRYNLSSDDDLVVEKTIHTIDHFIFVVLLSTELMGAHIFLSPFFRYNSSHWSSTHNIRPCLGITWVLQIPKPNCLGNLYVTFS